MSRAIGRYNKTGRSPSITDVLVHTGQHYDYNMSQVFFDQLDIPRPNYHLGVGSGRHGEQTATMLIRIEEVLVEEQPDLVLVYGDTNSTLAGALAAAKLNIPVVHVEAGLRSFNRRMPEEINRLAADHLSSILFCPTNQAVENLEREGVFDKNGTGARGGSLSEGNPFELKRRVLLVGDVMYDAFLINKEVASTKSRILKEQRLNPGGYRLATIHRQENTDGSERLGNIFHALDQLAAEGSPVVVALHPRTKKALKENRIGNTGNPNLRIIPPVSYLDMISLEMNAAVILTDSGGVQKEASFVRVPCVTLREETEWVETVDAGWNVLAGSDRERIMASVVGARPGKEGSLYGDGRASETIVDEIGHFFAS